MRRRQNVLLLVVDSLRAASLFAPGGPRTPFLQRLSASTVYFPRAHATECWTLPAHMSMFTGLLPSEHGAHFRSMEYRGAQPTIAELLREAGYRTELITRNSIFEGSLPGVTRGFERCTRPLARRKRLDPMATLLALSKPRFRRQIQSGGFFHPRQREQRDFALEFARATLPADDRALECVLARMQEHTARGEAFFVFCNLYDVHAPYCPSPRSIMRPGWSLSALVENVMLPVVLPKLGAHRYIRPGFRLSARARGILVSRYHRAIELMDARLEAFFDRATNDGLLDDTLVILTSDHGEAFGEHGLYLHDSSVYETHLHVPLWVMHPTRQPAIVDDVVSTRDLFGLMRAGSNGDFSQTLLSPSFAGDRGPAMAEHFHYDGAPDILPEFRHDLRAAIGNTYKVVFKNGERYVYDLRTDGSELRPQRASGRDATDIVGAHPWLN